MYVSNGFSRLQEHDRQHGYIHTVLVMSLITVYTFSATAKPFQAALLRAILLIAIVVTVA